MLAGCTTPETDEYTKFTIRELEAHLSFQYPKLYSTPLVTISSDNSVFMSASCLSETTDVYRVLNFLIQEPSDWNADSNSVLESDIKYSYTAEDGFQVAERSPVAVADGKGEQIVVHYDAPSSHYGGPAVPSVARIAYFDLRGHIWKVTLQSDVQTSEDAKADFDHILSSIKIRPYLHLSLRLPDLAAFTSRTFSAPIGTANVTFKYPASYEEVYVADTEAQLSNNVYLDKPYDMTTTINISAIDISANAYISLEDYVDALIKEVETGSYSMSDFKLLERIPWQSQALKGVQFGYTFTKGWTSREYVTREVYVRAGNELLIISMSSEMTNFEAVRSDFQRILNTLQVSGTTPPPQHYVQYDFTEGIVPFSMEYPDRYVLDSTYSVNSSRVRYSDVIFRGNREETSGDRLTITIESPWSGYSDANSAMSYRFKLASSEELQTATVSVAGVEGLETIYTTNNSLQTYFSIVVYFEHDGLIWGITMDTSLSWYYDHTPIWAPIRIAMQTAMQIAINADMQHILNSFTILE
jgi:hypothetical protein